MLHQIELAFLLFLTYSFLGWTMEILLTLVRDRKFINRGFLIGPYCPIYGVGSLLMVFFLQDYREDLIVLFCMAMVVCSILEYTTSVIMEKLFHARWWDYSHNKFNINGRICLETMIPFGLGGTLIVSLIHPFLLSVFAEIPSVLFHLLTGFLFGLFLLDLIVSCNIIMSFKKVATSIRKDNTEEITKRVKKVLMSKSALGKRLINAFPNLQATLGELSKKRYIFKRDKLRHEKRNRKQKF